MRIKLRFLLVGPNYARERIVSGLGALALQSKTEMKNLCVILDSEMF